MAAVSPPQIPETKYLEEYNMLSYHVGMLTDHVRMESYHKAIQSNAGSHFHGKVVLDVGAGTGILSIWAAQAGAARVYAVEATAVAEHARTLVKAHGVEDTVVVLQGKMEELELPELVDVVLSEWMGYFLLRESMVQSVLYARDRWLKPTGVMYPSHASIMLAALDEPGFTDAVASEVDKEMSAYDGTAADLVANHSLRFDALRDKFKAENVNYYYHQAWQGSLGRKAAVGSPQTLLSVDMHTTTMDELFGWSREVRVDLPCDSSSNESNVVRLLCGWFDVRFCADETRESGNAIQRPCVELSTSPVTPRTHWMQTTFVLEPPLPATHSFVIGLQQSRKSHHDLNVTVAYQESSGKEVRASYAVTQETRHDPRTESDLMLDEWYKSAMENPMD